MTLIKLLISTFLQIVKFNFKFKTSRKLPQKIREKNQITFSYCIIIGYNYKMFASFPSTRRCATPKLSTIKAQFDNKVDIIMRMLNSVHTPSKQHKLCQTDRQSEELQNQGPSHSIKTQKSIDLTNIWLQSMQSIDMKSNNSENQIFEQTMFTNFIHFGSNSRNDSKLASPANKCITSDLTPGRQRAKSKINNKNTSFQKLLKQRKKQSPRKKLQRDNLIQISTQQLSKMSNQIKQKSLRDRYESYEGYQLRRKMIFRIQG